LREPPPEEIAAEAEVLSKGEEKPPSVSVTLGDLDELPHSERVQFLQIYYGVQAASPEELAQMNALKHEQEMQKSELKMMKKPGEEGPPNEVAA